MALDHSRLGLENKFLENKSGRIFLRSTGLLYKFLPTNLGVCKPTFYTFYTSHLRWNSTLRRCFYHTELGQNVSRRKQYFTILRYKLHSFNIQDNWSIHGRLVHPLKIFPKSPIQPGGSHFWQVPNWSANCPVFEWTLIELHFNIIKNLFCLFFI